MDLDPRYLRTFYEVGRSRSFSDAAMRLHKTQPAVSYQIRQLEQQLATTLFDRTTRTLALTPAGTRLLDLCERFFGEFGQLVASLADPSALVPDPLRIASVSAFGRYVLFPILAATQLPYSLRFPTAEQIVDALEDGSCDLGFVYVPIVSNRFRTMPVWREELVLLAPPRSPRKLPRSLDDFSDVVFVTYDESEYVFGKWFEVVFGRPPRVLRNAYHFEEVEEVVATVASGRGWSIVPEDCTRHPAAKRAITLRHPRHRVHNQIYAVTRASAREHATTASIFEALASAARR